MGLQEKALPQRHRIAGNAAVVESAWQWNGHV